MSVEDIRIAIEFGRAAAVSELKRNPTDSRTIGARLAPQDCKPLVDALRSVPEICELEGKFLCTPQGGAWEIKFEAVAGNLIERSLSADPASISLSIHRIATERTYTWYEVRFLEFCRLDKRHDFGDGFTAWPSAHLPAEYKPHPILYHHLMHGEHTKPEEMTPIVRRRKLNLDVIDNVPTEDWDEAREATPQSDWDAILDTIILASSGAPKWGVSYQNSTDLGWFGAMFNGGGKGGSHFGPVEIVREIDKKIANVVFEPLRHADPSHQLAIRMLAKARRRKFEVTEKVIDLGTCAEILLMNKSKENSEISMKVGLRAAWYLDGGPDQRVKSFDTIRELYSLRSAAVHSGEMPRARGADRHQKQRETISEADELLVKLLLKMLANGIPADSDWKKIVLHAS